MEKVIYFIIRRFPLDEIIIVRERDDVGYRSQESLLSFPYYVSHIIILFQDRRRNSEKFIITNDISLYNLQFVVNSNRS